MGRKKLGNLLQRASSRVEESSATDNFIRRLINCRVAYSDVRSVLAGACVQIDTLKAQTNETDSQTLEAIRLRVFRCLLDIKSLEESKNEGTRATIHGSNSKTPSSGV